MRGAARAGVDEIADASRVRAGVVQTTASSGAFSPTSSNALDPTRRPRLRRGLRRDLGCFRDLARDLHDVLFRLEDVELAVGAVAATQNLVDSGEAPLPSEVACRAGRSVFTAFVARALPRAGGAAARVEVITGARGVARREPLVLGREDRWKDGISSPRSTSSA